MFLHKRYGHHDKELSELILSQLMRFFAISLVLLFIPIYLHGLNYSFYSIMWFFAMHFFFLIPFFFIGLKVVSHVGFKKSIAMSIPLTILYLYLFIALESRPIPLTILAAILALSNALYWAGAHADIAKNSTKKKRGRQVALIKGSRIGLKVISPILGASIVYLFGFTSLFKVAITLMVLSMVPFFFTKDRTYKFNFSMKRFWSAHTLSDGFYYFCEGINHQAYLIILPFLVFLSGISLLKLGGLFSFTNLAAFVGMFAIGKLIDGGKNFLRLGAWINGILLALTALVQTLFGFSTLIVLRDLLSPLLLISFEKVFYDKARTLEYIFVREFWMGVGRMGFHFLLILIFSFLGDVLLTLKIGLVLGGIATVFMSGFK